MKQDIMQPMREIKVSTKRFSLKKGVIRLTFCWRRSEGAIVGLCLRQRNSLEECSYPFHIEYTQKGEYNLYKARIDVNEYPLEIAFWDVVAQVESPQENYEAILGGLSALLKIRFILRPRWTKTADGHLIYPFVNGARQFTIQYRKYDKKYDSIRFLLKEYLALFCYFILKPYWDHKKVWLVCEKFSAMAQDNGLYFFQYCMEQLPESERKKIYYVMDKSAKDYQAVQQFEPQVISFMSFRYMIYLCAAEYLISTDAIRHFYIWDSPNSVFKVLYQARKHIIFLQHGVMGFKQCHRTFHKKGGNRMRLFVVSSEYEQDIIHDYFEYDRDEIIITGLSRWDVLEDHSSMEHQEILLMPTWRPWLENASKEIFLKSDYYKNYQSLLQNRELWELLNEKKVELNFYIHPKFREYIGQFASGCDRIHMIPFGSRPLNELLMSCNLLITDYSSVAWDVYYQEKPVLFFTFDLDTYEELQGSYMDLRTEAFGDVVTDTTALIQTLESYVDNGYQEKECYRQRRDYLLPYRDHRNSERIYQKIKELKPEPKLKISAHKL